MGVEFDSFASAARAAHQVVAGLSGAPSISLLEKQFAALTRRYGFENAICVELPPNDAPICAYTYTRRQWPDPWATHYRDQEYYRRDPYLKEAGINANAYTWAEVEANRVLDPHAQRIKRLHADYGLEDGFVAPMPGPQGRPAIVCLAGRKSRIHLDPNVRRVLYYTCAAMFTRLTMLLNAESQSATYRALFTSRQMQCIQLAARGANNPAIAKALGVSPRTVQDHLDQARARIGASTRAQVIAFAFEHHIIDL